MNNEIYIVTDGCMWEDNKQNNTFHPHAVEVVDIRTGQVRYIKSGSRIKFVEGEITGTRDQEAYNRISAEVSVNSKDKLSRTDGKKRSRKAIKKKRNQTARV